MVFKLLCSVLVNFRENDGIEVKKNSHFTITNGFKRVESTNCRLNSRNTQRVFVILSKNDVEVVCPSCIFETTYGVLE